MISTSSSLTTEYKVKMALKYLYTNLYAKSFKDVVTRVRKVQKLEFDTSKQDINFIWPFAVTRNDE